MRPQKSSGKKNLVYTAYKGNAKSRGLVFEIDRDTLVRLCESDCVYCGSPPSRIKRTSDMNFWMYNGIDRSDNTQGYTMKNCVPCCKRCNFYKGNDNGYVFLSHVFRIHAHIERTKGAK